MLQIHLIKLLSSSFMGHYFNSAMETSYFILRPSQQEGDLKGVKEIIKDYMPNLKRCSV